jgi:hypothetical protein
MSLDEDMSLGSPSAWQPTVAAAREIFSASKGDIANAGWAVAVPARSVMTLKNALIFISPKWIVADR